MTIKEILRYALIIILIVINFVMLGSIIGNQHKIMDNQSLINQRLKFQEQLIINNGDIRAATVTYQALKTVENNERKNAGIDD